MERLTRIFAWIGMVSLASVSYSLRSLFVYYDSYDWDFPNLRSPASLGLNFDQYWILAISAITVLGLLLFWIGIYPRNGLLAAATLVMGFLVVRSFGFENDYVAVPVAIVIGCAALRAAMEFAMRQRWIERESTRWIDWTYRIYVVAVSVLSALTTVIRLPIESLREAAAAIGLQLSTPAEASLAVMSWPESARPVVTASWYVSFLYPLLFVPQVSRYVAWIGILSAAALFIVSNIVSVPMGFIATPALLNVAFCAWFLWEPEPQETDPVLRAESSVSANA